MARFLWPVPIHQVGHCCSNLGAVQMHTVWVLVINYFSLKLEGPLCFTRDLVQVKREHMDSFLDISWHRYSLDNTMHHRLLGQLDSEEARILLFLLSNHVNCLLRSSHHIPVNE